MMTTKPLQIVSRIRNYLIDHFPSVKHVPMLMEETSLLENGIIDSLGVLDLVCFLEKEFKIAISDEDLLPDNFESITNLASFVQEKCNEQLIV